MIVQDERSAILKTDAVTSALVNWFAALDACWDRLKLVVKKGASYVAMLDVDIVRCKVNKFRVFFV